MSQSEARRRRRECAKKGDHLWKTGKRPEDGRFCARCGTVEVEL